MIKLFIGGIIIGVIIGFVMASLLFISGDDK